MQVLPELRRYLTLKKWKYKPDGTENICIQTCPFCGKNKWKFTFHAARGLYRCWNCGAKGNLRKLKKQLGDGINVVNAAQMPMTSSRGKKPPRLFALKFIERWHKALLADRETIEYLKSRGFTQETVKHFKLGLRKQGRSNWLAIPHLGDGECHNVKFRSLPPAEKTFRRINGCESVLFNSDALLDFEEIVICEAELDAISFWQAGVKNVIGLTCGADTFLPDWYDLVADKEKVYLCLDADHPGQFGARNIARRIGFDKCLNILLPAHDANQVIQSYGRAAGEQVLRDSLATAERFEVAGVIRASDGMMQCHNNEELGGEGILTPWPDVNRLIGRGWQPGDLISLSAKVKTGKTTFALNECIFLARKNIPALVYCLEMSVPRLLQKVAANLRLKEPEDLDKIDYLTASHMLKDAPLYLIEPEWGVQIKVENVLDKIREAVKRYGIRYLVFDNLHFLCRSLNYLTNEIGQVTRSFKLVSEELGITTCLIAQPRKINSDRVMRHEDIKDSSAPGADSDQIIILHRNPVPSGMSKDAFGDETSEQEVLESKTLVRVDASRYSGGGECYLHYQGAYSRFIDYQK